MTSVSPRSTRPTVTDFFGTFWVHLNQFSRATGTEKEAIREGSIRVRRLDSFARLIVKDQTTDNCAAVALMNRVWYITANNYAAIKKNLDAISKALKKVETDSSGMVISTKMARAQLIDKYLTSVKNPVIHARLVRDVRKFLASLKTTEIFRKTEINKLLNEDIYIYENPSQLHAEILILSDLVIKSKEGTVTLGISKLCCKLCAAALAAFQKQLKVDFRGRHGNFYFAWKPSLQLLQKELFNQFIGKEAALLYWRADFTTKKKIIAILSNLKDYRADLQQHEGHFIPNRGAVMLRSGSPTPESSMAELDTMFDALTLEESDQQFSFSEEWTMESELEEASESSSEESISSE